MLGNRRFTYILVLGMALLVLAGCVPLTPTPSATATPAPTATPTETPEGTVAPEEVSTAPAANAVEVKLTEFEIQMPETIPPGPTAFQVENIGAIEHNFEIEGEGVEQAFDSNLAAGETNTMEIELEPGTYEVYCPVGDHAEQGMRLELTVAETESEARAPERLPATGKGNSK